MSKICHIKSIYNHLYILANFRKKWKLNLKNQPQKVSGSIFKILIANLTYIGFTSSFP
jgi:hypothetical protein